MVTHQNTDVQEQNAKILISAAEARAPKGVGALSAGGWYKKNIHCPQHDDQRPSCSVKADGSLYCHACDAYWGQREAAQLLDVTLLIPEGGWHMNRRKRRRAGAVGRKVARQSKDILWAKVMRDLPRRYHKLMRLLIQQSVRFGTCAMSQTTMGMLIGRTREHVCRQMGQLREMGWVKKLGYYCIGFNPSLSLRGLWMRVNIETPFISEAALDLNEKSHTMFLILAVESGILPKFVHMTGFSARILYSFTDIDIDVVPGPPGSRKKFPI